jgi:hypothetical protein
VADDKVKDALERYEESTEGWSDTYSEASKDLQFIDANNQWDEDARKYLKSKNQLALTLNKIPKFINRVANQIRLNTPAIKVSPMDSGADVETAEILQGLIRNIEYISGADAAYDTAVTDAIKCSIGFFRVDHDYTAPDTFEQHILIKRVVNPLSIKIDPMSVEPDGSDMRYGFVTDTLDKDDFKSKYPDAEPVSFDTKSYKDQHTAGEEITLAEHFYIKQEEVDIGLIIDPLSGEQKIVILQEGYDLSPVKTRKIKKNKVYRCKVSGAEVLEESIFPSAYVPIIPVYGEEHYIDGKRHLYSLVRNMKEAQRLYNLGKSLEVSLLKKAPKNQWVAAEGQVHGYENAWKNPDSVETMIYKPFDLKGNLLPPPRRESPPPIPPAVMALSAGAMEDLKDISGIYDSSLGAKSNETSGKAIQERQNEGELATAHFEDNLRRSIRHCGRILVDMIPRIYDTERIVRVIGQEDEQKLVNVNGQKLHEGQKRPFDLSTGKYDVNVTTGQSFASKRAETAALMGDIMRGNPELMGVMGDLMFKYMDVAGAEQIASRLKKTIPPNLLDESEREEQEMAPDPEKMQMAQMLEQAQMGMQQMQQQVMALEQQLKDKQMETALKAKSEQVKAENDKIKLSLEGKKLELEEQKIQIEAFRAQMEASQPQEGKTPEQSQPAQSSAPINLILDKDSIKNRDEIEAQESLKGQEETKIRLAQTQAVMGGLSEISQQLAAMAQAINTPKTVVRDDAGKVVGVQ